MEAQLLAPGAPFELCEEDVFGERVRVFKNGPPSLRALFDTARGRGDATFLVYEDERWSFAEDITGLRQALAAVCPDPIAGRPS